MTRPTFPSRRVRRIFCSLSRDRCLFVLSVLGVKRATERWQKPLGRRCQSPTVKRHFSPQYDALARHSPKGVPAEEALCAWGGWGAIPKARPRESSGTHTVGTDAPGWPMSLWPNFQKETSCSSPSLSLLTCCCVWPLLSHSKLHKISVSAPGP